MQIRLFIPLFCIPTEAYYTFNYQNITSYVTIITIMLELIQLNVSSMLCRVSEITGTPRCTRNELRYHYITELVLAPNVLYLTIFIAFREV